MENAKLLLSMYAGYTPAIRALQDRQGRAKHLVTQLLLQVLIDDIIIHRFERK